MPQRIFINLGIILLCLNFFSPLNFAGQNDSLLENGVQSFRDKNFKQAKNILNQYISRSPAELKKRIALLYIAKCEMQLREYLPAETKLIQLVNSSGGEIFEDVCITLSELYWKQKKKNEVVEYLLLLSDSLYTKARFSLVFNYLSAVIDNLSEKEIKVLPELPSIKQKSDFLFLLIGKYYYRKGVTGKAEDYLLKVITNYPQSRWHSEALKVYTAGGDTELSDTGNLKKNIIAVVLPLSGSKNDKKSAANEVLDGIKLAINNHNGKSKDRYFLWIFDSARNKRAIAEISAQIRMNKNVAAVIGALYSDETEFLANELATLDIPLIAPTATDDTLTAINKYLIQANPSFVMRGRSDAEYILKYEGKRSIAVMYAEEGYSAISAKAFIEHFHQSGGTVVFQNSFSQSRTDLREIIQKIRQFSNDIEGIYIPVSERHAVRKILTEFSKADIHIPIYGNQDWFQPPVLDDFPSYAGMMVISSDYFIDYSDAEYFSLNEKFHLVKHYDINRNVLYGYDAANFLLQNIDTQNFTPSDTRKKLKGLHNDIITGIGRINTSMNFIRYQNGIFYLITRIHQEQ